jgi:hypothetical protein
MSDFSFRPYSLADLVLDEIMTAVQQKSGRLNQNSRTALNSVKSKACAPFRQRGGGLFGLYITLHQPHQPETEPSYLPLIESGSNAGRTGS